MPATTNQDLIGGATILVDAKSLCEECTMLGDPSQQRMSPIQSGSKPSFQSVELGAAQVLDIAHCRLCGAVGVVVSNFGFGELDLCTNVTLPNTFLQELHGGLGI